LRKDGKRVIIAGLPCTGSAKVNEEEGLWNKEANKLLAEYVTRLAAPKHLKHELVYDF